MPGGIHANLVYTEYDPDYISAPYASKFRQVVLTPPPNGGPVKNAVPQLPWYSQSIDACPGFNVDNNYTQAFSPVSVGTGTLNTEITEIPTIYPFAIQDPDYYG